MAPRLLLMALMLLVFWNLSFASKLVRFEGNLDNSVHVVGNLDKSVETGSGEPISQGIGTSGVRFESNFDKTVELVGNLDKLPTSSTVLSKLLSNLTPLVPIP